MRLDYLWRGLPGHPIHPPLTDAAIGTYTFATVMALVDAFGLAEQNAAKAWWLALVVGLIVTVPTALTGFADWLTISWGTPMWRTATTHLIVMVSATVLFGLAALVGHGPYEDGDVTAGPLLLTLAGFVALTAGGWLGGTITFVHGMRVLSLPEEPAARATAPVAYPEKEEAEA